MKLSKMTKEEIEQLSYTKIAELYLNENKTTMATGELFDKVCELLELSKKEYQDKIADFFESLTTSKTFILLNDGKWDLRSNHTVKVEIDKIYDDKDEEIESFEEGLDELEEDYEEDYDNAHEENYDEEDDELSDLTIIDEDELE